MELETKFTISEIVKSPNLAEKMTEEDLRKIGQCVVADWEVDKQSRSEWDDRTAEAYKLALQVMDEKTFPWEGASNVKFPLLTIAALQYQSRAYPALIPSTSVVKARVIGTDPTGEKAARASRISQYMSYQVLEQDECWEENMDKVLIVQAILGCAFKKTYYDPSLRHNVSELVLPKDLYIPYFAPSLEKASRITQHLYMRKNELVQKYRKGIYLEADCHVSNQMNNDSPIDAARDEAQGLVDPANESDKPYDVLEQHRWLDLDGDGFDEPYIVTVLRDNEQVLRIVARFNKSGVEKNAKGEVSYIAANHFYTKFPFIPSPDGGIYDLGFGVLLGPINESINSILNQLVDAGTLSNTAGGFLGRGVKFRSGDNSFRPFEWKRVDSTGEDLHKGVFPLPVREPSMVLYQTLSLLIDYGERIGMAVDPLVGVNPGQNTPAETSRNMIAEGQRIFNAVFKRTYRALKEEFRKLYKLNSIFVQDEQEFYSLINDGANVVFASDFSGDGRDVVPAADPNLITDEQKIQTAMLIKEAAATTPGYNTYNVERNFLEAMKVPDVESFFPDPKGPNALPEQGPEPKIAVEFAKIQQKDKEFQANMQLKMFELQQEVQYIAAEIAKKEAESAKLLAEAESIESGQQIAALQQAVSLMKQKQDGIKMVMDHMKDFQKMNLEKEKIDVDRQAKLSKPSKE